jgi:cytochrome c peroxidase
MRARWLLIAAGWIVSVLGGAVPAGGDPAGTGAAGADAGALARIASPPLGLPPVPVPVDGPPTIEKIALGRKLFFDRRLSFNRTMSCGMCHVPEQAFTQNELATPVGVEGRSIRRNAPTIVNVAYAGTLFHDGRETSLETQVVNPLLARDEMANPSMGWVIAKVRDLDDYDGLFERAFGGGPSVDRIGSAIASWERTMLAGDSPFDRWRYGGADDALATPARQGFELFTGQAGCDRCHTVGPEHALFTDGAFHDTGIGAVSASAGDTSSVPVEVAPGQVIAMSRAIVESISEPRPADLGRFEVTLDPADKGRFKTPSLRNVALTAPYMHDGSLRTLEEVVRFYDRGGVPHEGLDPLIRPLFLTDEDVAALVAFLESLTSPHMDALAADARSAGIGN